MLFNKLKRSNHYAPLGDDDAICRQLEGSSSSSQDNGQMTVTLSVHKVAFCIVAWVLATTALAFLGAAWLSSSNGPATLDIRPGEFGESVQLMAHLWPNAE